MEKVWEDQVKYVDMTALQEAMLSRALCEHCEEEDHAPVSMESLIRFAVVMAGECLEAISKLDGKIVHKDLLVQGAHIWTLFVGLLVPLIVSPRYLESSTTAHLVGVENQVNRMK